MDCKDCKQLLSKFLDHELDHKQQQMMTNHIEDCPACAQSLESITEMVNMLHKIKAINPPVDFVKNVNKRLDQLPFWNKVLIGIKSVFFQNKPARLFVLMAILILIFGIISQLNLLSKKLQIESEYIKANKEQVLILKLDEQSNVAKIKEILFLKQTVDLSMQEHENAQIFLFKIPYAEFLNLHSDLAGIGQLEKSTPNVELYENINQSMSWQKQAFQQLITVRLEVRQ
jgi:Putative zinc-finger